MAMVTPIGVAKSAFDATKNSTFYFTSTGGNQVVSNKITIYNNENNSVVYTNTVESYAFNQVVPANTLVNGTAYNYTFITYDINGNASNPSNPVLFYCYSTPSFNFTNIFPNDEISTSVYTFNITYSQSEGELCNFVNFYLYDNNNIIVQQSNDIYSTSSSSTETFSYTMSNLENNITYKIKAVGITMRGMQVETDLIQFSVFYDYPPIFMKLQVDNLCNKGYNQIISNIIEFDGETIPSEPHYVDGEKLDLLNIKQQDRVKWSYEKGIINRDFGMQIWYEVGLEGKEFILKNVDNENTYMIGKIVREIPYGQTQAYDYVDVTGFVDGVEKFYIRSNYVPLVNSTTYLILTFTYAPYADTYSLVLHTYDQENNYAKWKNYKALTNVLITQDDDVLVTQDDDSFGMVYDYVPNVETLYSPLATHNDDNIITQDDDYIICTHYDLDFSNTKYNRLTNLRFGNTTNIVGSYHAENHDMGTSIFPIGTVELYNGLYDHIEFYKDFNRTYSPIKTDWSYGTLLLCNFNENIIGGNVQIALENLQAIRIKAREVGTFDYITLYEVPITSATDLGFTRFDYRVPHGSQIEYSMVLVYNGGIEGDRFTNVVDNIWRKMFVSDSTMTLSLIGNVSVGDMVKNVPSGVLQPIDSVYPIVVRNGSNNYYSGNIKGTILSDDYSELNRLNITELRNTWGKFLTNGLTKVIKDWNGNIFVAQITGQPSFSPIPQLGNGIGNITFSFVEQGKWDNQNDLYQSGIVDIAG